MDILVMGGTRFLGRTLVEVARARGHEVTLFNRGQTNPNLFGELEKLRGDRDGDLDVLQGRRWDAVIDPSGYIPRVVLDSAELLADASDHYTFISTLSVYADFATEGLDESAPLATMEDESVEEITDESYGPLKVLCERAVQDIYGERGLIIRPGLIVGPHDPTDRFTYWPVRVARGGEVLAPGSAATPVQFIDVRDLALWTIQLVEARQSGIYNATGPEEGIIMGDLLATCRRVSASTAKFTWVDESFLLDHGVTPFTEMPLWIPGDEALGFGTVDVQRAIADGLRFRPLEETVEDTLEWANGRPKDYEWRAGLSDEREAELLREWYEEQADDVTGQTPESPL